MISLILASGSAVRARLLAAAGVAFDVVPADVDEDIVKESFVAGRAPPKDLADALAELKARKVSASHRGAFVIGADQVLVFQEDIISKSSTLGEAYTLLRRLSGDVHELVAAVVLVKDGVVLWRHVSTAKMHMRKVSDAFLEGYLEAQGEAILTSVGCYHFEKEGAQLFSQAAGDYFTILGLPLLPLLNALRELGVLET